ncbi:MAG TPA: hypothetical protein DDY98_02340 [Ruminococcaceae bacterium]|nr:hypothetical protein [Oscillospiraceae bacterium]
MSGDLLNAYYEQTELPLHPRIDAEDYDNMDDLQTDNEAQYYDDFCKDTCWDEKDTMMKQCFTSALQDSQSYEKSLDDTSTWLSAYFRIAVVEDDVPPDFDTKYLDFLFASC